MAVDAHAVDFLYMVGEEVGNVFVGGPVQGYAQRVVVSGLKLLLKILAGKPVGTEPVQVGKLLVGELVKLAVGRRGELQADEIAQVEPGVGKFASIALHVVTERHYRSVAIVGSDEIRI